MNFFHTIYFSYLRLMNKTVIHQISMTGIGGVQQSFLAYFNKALRCSTFKHVVYGMHHIDDYYDEVAQWYININASLVNKIKFLYCLHSRRHIVHFYNNIGSKKIHQLLQIFPSSNVIFHERGTIWNAKEKDRDAYQYNASKARIVLANSQATKTMLIQRFGIKKDKIQVIYNGFLPDKQSVDCKEIKRYAEKFSIGYIGRLDTPKGVHILIKAARKLVRYNFYIAGDGAWKNALVELAKECGNVYFIGRVKEPLKFIEKMDLIVVPSIREPLGNTIIEAGFCKKPVIASNVDGIPEIIENGVNGILLTPNQELSISDLPIGAVPIPMFVIDHKGQLQKPKEIDSTDLAKSITQLEKNPSQREEL